jgi:hypothetical protein
MHLEFHDAWIHPDDVAAVADETVRARGHHWRAGLPRRPGPGTARAPVTYQGRICWPNRLTAAGCTVPCPRRAVQDRLRSGRPGSGRGGPADRA